MTDESRDEDLSLEGFRKFLEFVAPMSRSLIDHAPLRGELLQHFRAVTVETDQYANQFLDEDMKHFMQTLARNIAARHPDYFMEHTAQRWASAIESFLFVRFIDDIHPVSKRRAMLGACRYVAPGVKDLMGRIDALLPQTPALPDDPEIMAWMEAIALGEADAGEDEREPDEEAESDNAGAVGGRIEGLVDPGYDAVPGEVREYYRRIIHHTDVLGEFIGDKDLTALMRQFARLFVVYGSTESRTIVVEDVALFIEVMALEILAGPADENHPSEFADLETGLKRGNEELLETLRISVGRDAIVPGLKAEGLRPPPESV